MITREDMSVELERALYDSIYANIQDYIDSIRLDDFIIYRSTTGYIQGEIGYLIDNLSYMVRWLSIFDLMTPSIELELMPYIFAGHTNTETKE